MYDVKALNNLVLTYSIKKMKNNKEIVSPVTDHVLAPRTSAEEAKKAGRFVYDKPTLENSIILFVDHQIGLMAGVRDFESLSAYKSNVIGLAKMAKAAKIPVLLTSSNTQWQNGDIFPELKEIFSGEPIYRRTGIISGVTIGTCCTFPTLSMLQDGYKVYPVIDACGGWSKYETDAAVTRMANAGAEPVTVFPLACELQADWKGPIANDMFTPFIENLPESSFIIQLFNSTANGTGAKDPFKEK